MVEDMKLLWKLYPEVFSFPKEFESLLSFPPSMMWPNSSGYPELDKNIWDYVEENYVVAQDRDSDKLNDAINEIFRESIESTIEGNGYSYKIQQRTHDQMEFQPGFGLILKRQKRPIVYDIKNSMQKTVAITCILELISQAIRKNITVTHRGAYYIYPEIFNSAAFCRERIYDVACMLACRSSSLFLQAESTGSVFGPLVIADAKSGESINCLIFNEGVRIPVGLSGISFKTNANIILVVEKKSFFRHLIETRQYLKDRVILVTGNGMPGLATRAFLKKLHVETGLQVYAIVDPDPSGIKILFSYAFGSTDKSYDNLGLALPSIMWLHITARELITEGVPTRCLSPISNSEIKDLNNLVNDAHLQYLIPDSWRNAIGSMCVGQFKNKASLESLNAIELDYAGRIFIPKKLMDKKQYQTSVRRTRLSKDIATPCVSESKKTGIKRKR